MEWESECSPFQSQRPTQPKSNTEDEKIEEEDKMAESKGSFSSDEKKGKRPMKGKPKGVLIGVAAKESDGERPPSSKRRRRADTEVKSSYSLRSENKDSEEKEAKGKEKEEKTQENEDTDQNIAEGSDDDSESMVREIHIKLEEFSW